MRACARLFAAVALVLCVPLAHASFHTYRIEQLYTNADGTVQFVVLRESAGADGEHVWGGRTLTTTGAAGMQQFAFPANLPSAGTAGTRVLVATPAFAALGIVAPDYSIPANFLPLGGGTINFAGIDQFAFGALPTDGVMALTRAGFPMQNLATNFAGATGSVTAGRSSRPSGVVSAINGSSALSTNAVSPDRRAASAAQASARVSVSP